MSDNGAVASLSESVLKGNYVEEQLTQSGDTKKFVLDNNVFKAFDSSKAIAANQCWVECNQPQATELTICFSDPTGIEEITSTPQGKSAGIYDIAGKKLDTPQKGINIIDSKKVLVK